MVSPLRSAYTMRSFYNSISSMFKQDRSLKACREPETLSCHLKT
jgi:hypothetical protein